MKTWQLGNHLLEFIEEDELVEITPKNIRLRKKILDNKTRERMAARLKK